MSTEDMLSTADSVTAYDDFTNMTLPNLLGENINTTTGTVLVHLLSNTTNTPPATVFIQPDIILESLNNASTLEFLTPLIVILLATLLAIIILFSCVLCTCTSPSGRRVSVRVDNSSCSVDTAVLREGITLYKCNQFRSLPLLDEQRTEWCNMNGHSPYMAVDAMGVPVLVNLEDESRPHSPIYPVGNLPGGYYTLSQSELALDRVTVL